MKFGFGKIVGAVLFAAGVAAIWLWPKQKAEVAEEAVVRPVRSMVVSNRATLPELRCPGRVRAGETRDLMFEVPGRLVEFKLDRGQRVKKGDVLAKLDARDYEADVKKAEALALDVAPDVLAYGQKFVLGPGDAQKIQFRILGPDPKVLRRAAERALAILRADGGLKEIQSDWRNRVDVLVPDIAEDRARKLGVTRSDIARSFKQATEGLTVGSYLEGDESLPIVVRAPVRERNDPDSLRSSWVWSSSLGCSVPFAQVATGIHVETEEAIFKRRNRLPCITVKCNPKSGTAAAARLRVADKLEALGKTLPAGYACEWGGEYESSGDANSGLAGKIPPILAIMVLIVVMLFNSLKQTLVIFMTVPLILVGVVAGLLGFDQPFGFMALLGFLSLVGMQIKNAIVMMDEINAQLAAGARPFDAVVASGVTRLRPVANTALTTVLGMMPLVADAFYAAMAVTIMCGLAFATLLTMVVIPVNYALLYRVRK